MDNLKKRTCVLYGGAASGKSVAVAQHLCRIVSENRNLKILVIRKTRGENEASCFALMQEIFAAWEIPVKINLTKLEIRFRNSTIYFRGLDRDTKFKSIEYNQIWIEEPDEITEKEFNMINLRLRRPGKIPRRMYLTFNPISSNHWAVKQFVDGHDPSKGAVFYYPKDDDAEVLHSTWRDNRYVTADYIEYLKGLKKKDEQLYRVYNLGLPGVLVGVIYHNWKQLDFDLWPEYIKNSPPHFYMLDFGHGEKHHMAFLEGWEAYPEGRRRTIYLNALLYRTGLITRDLLDWFKEEGIYGDVPMYADPSRADSILEIRRAGYDIYGADNAVKDGIDYVKGVDLILNTWGEPNLYLKREITNYKWKTLPSGKEEPVKVDDHLMDAMRYGIFTSRPYSDDDDEPDMGSYYDPTTEIPVMYDNQGIPEM